MKRTDTADHDNKKSIQGSFTTQVLDENPYLQRPAVDGKEPSEESFDTLVEDEFGPPTEAHEGSNSRQRLRRFVLVGMAIVLLLAIAIALALYRRSPTRVDYGKTAKQTEVLPPPSNSKPTGLRDSRTDKAIEEAQRLTGEQSRIDRPVPVESPRVPSDPNSKTVLETPFKVPSGYDPTLNPSEQVSDTRPNAERTAATHSTPEAPTTASNLGRSQRSSETSLYMNEQPTERSIKPTIDKKGDTEKKTPLITEARDHVALPAFASMLPVRTLGALYTLRTGALVRFELTRETKGDGWSMKRGTILVGTSKGGDFDRAYVSLVGFIDTHSGKLVKLGGDVLGGDGATGLKGKRRPINGGWSRAFARVGSAAIDITGALLSGRGRDTVIISDGVRTRAINPITDEVSGLLGSELNRTQGQSFVEVLAGTPGYVLVTELPSTIEGTEQRPELNADRLTLLTNVDTPRAATGLTEREFADLLSTDSPEEIRAAMPRMSPEMRKVAEAVLRP